MSACCCRCTKGSCQSCVCAQFRDHVGIMLQMHERILPKSCVCAQFRDHVGIMLHMHERRVVCVPRPCTNCFSTSCTNQVSLYDIKQNLVLIKGKNVSYCACSCYVMCWHHACTLSTRGNKKKRVVTVRTCVG